MWENVWRKWEWEKLEDSFRFNCQEFNKEKLESPNDMKEKNLLEIQVSAQHLFQNKSEMFIESTPLFYRDPGSVFGLQNAASEVACQPA